MQKKRTIVFYGDSNTYGFDPRGYFGGRYAEEEIWTSRIAAEERENWQVKNEGMNGRQLPFGEGGFRYPERLLRSLSEEDLFVIMLGTNDILMTMDEEAKKPVSRMEQFLRKAAAMERRPKILVIGPVLIGPEDSPDPLMRLFHDAGRTMNGEFRKLAEKYGVFFADASGWEIPLAYDGVHFSEEGHKMFAQRMLPVLRRIMQ